MTPSSIRYWNLFGTAIVIISVLMLSTGHVLGQEEEEPEDPEDVCTEEPFTIRENGTDWCAGIHLPRNGTSNCDMLNTTRLCVENAGCNPLYLSSPEATGTEGFCACSPGFAAHGNGTCAKPYEVPKFGDHCYDEVAICSTTQHLKCDPATWRCACRFKDDVHDSTIEGCKSRADGVCSVEPIEGVHRVCHRNSLCQKFVENLPYGLCKCISGFCPDQDGICSVEMDTCLSPTKPPDDPPARTTLPPDNTRPTNPDVRSTVPDDDDDLSTTETSAGKNIVCDSIIVYLTIFLFSILWR